MQELFVSYLRNSLSLSVVALLIMAFYPLISRRYSAKCRYYLWAVIFVALLFPIRPQVSVTLPQFIQPFLTPSTTEVTTILPSTAGILVSETPHIFHVINTWNWFQYAVLLWGIGVMFFLGWHIIQHLRFISSSKRWSKDIEDVAVLELFAYIKSELGIQDNIIIKSCACINTPMLAGLFRPVVLIPQNSFDQEELRLILKHELIHQKRRDLWYKVLMMLVLAIHWFNPVVYFMVRSAMNLCEISCDEEVLKGIDVKGRAKYGESIIGVVRNGSTCQTVLSTNFYSGTKGMEQRIYAMMDMTTKRFSPFLLLAIMIITLCGTATFAINSEQEKAKGSSELTNGEIKSSQNKFEPDSNADISSKSEINNHNLPFNVAVQENDKEYLEMNSDFVIISEETKKELKKELRENVVNSLMGLYCYDENGGVIMTPEILEDIKRAH